jgi:hypothetical protein
MIPVLIGRLLLTSIRRRSIVIIIQVITSRCYERHLTAADILSI